VIPWLFCEEKKQKKQKREKEETRGRYDSQKNIMNLTTSG
jgi:hypothetical protein